MNHFPNPVVAVFRLCVLALLALAVAAPQPAEAQRRGSQRAEQPEPMFPNATRKDVTPRTSTRVQRQIQSLFEAYNDEQDAKVESIANELLGNQKAGDYAHAMANRMLAEVANNRDDTAQAIEYLRQAIDSDAMPNEQHFQSMLLLAQLLSFEDREQEGLEVLRAFLEGSGSSDPQHKMMVGQALYRLERYDEAAAQIREAMTATDKPDRNWKKLLLAVHIEGENIAAAIATAEELVAEDNDDKPLLVNLASLYLDAEQPAKAAALLEDGKARGVFTSEEDYERLYRLYYNIEGGEDKTIAIINEGLEKGILKPGHQVYNLLAQVYYFSDRVEPAIEAWTKALEYATDGRSALNLARVLYNEERYPEAKSVVERAIGLGLEQPGEGYVTLGNIELYGLGNRSAAATAFNEALKHEGGHRQQAETGLKAARR